MVRSHTNEEEISINPRKWGRGRCLLCIAMREPTNAKGLTDLRYVHLKGESGGFYAM